MNKLILTDVIKNLFTKNRQCIINADIDGIMAGMLLQKFLNWNVVGYSSCRENMMMNYGLKRMLII